MSGDEWHGNPSRAYGHMESRKTEKCPYLYENERSKSSCKKHAHGRNDSMCFGQQTGDRGGAGGQFGFGGDRLMSGFGRKEFNGNRRAYSKKHNNNNNANGTFNKRGNINFSMEGSRKSMEDGNYATAGDDSSSEKESIDSGKGSYQSSRDETPTVNNEYKHHWRWGDSRRPRGKGYRLAKGRHKGSGIGHQEKSPLDMSLKEKICKFGVFLKSKISQHNAIQTIEIGLAKCRLGLMMNFDVDENKTESGKPIFTGVLKLSGVFVGQASGFTIKATKHKAYETALDNLTRKSVDEIFQLKDPVIETERDKEVVSAKTSNMAIKDAESAQAGNRTVSQNRDEELVSADLETNHKTHVQIGDGDIGQAENNKLKNEEAVSLESGGYKTHMSINANSVQTGENNTQIVNISPSHQVSIDQTGNANSLIVNIILQEERRPSNSVRGSDSCIYLKIQISRRDGSKVVHAEDLEDLGLKALITEEGELIIRAIETALDVKIISIFKGSIIIRLRGNKNSISKLRSTIESEQLHKILARIVHLKNVRLAVLENNILLNVTACIPMEDFIAKYICFTEKDSICIRFNSSSKDVYSKLKTKVENGQLHRILASIFKIEPVHSALKRSDLVMNVTASVTEGNERPLASEACTWKSQDQVKLLVNDSSDISPSSLPDISPCTLCKNGMMCLHHSIQSEPETDFDSSVRTKTKVENGQLQRILDSTSEIEPVHSALGRSDLVMNVTASVTEGNERPLGLYACTWKSQDQVKLLVNDSSDISPSSSPEFKVTEYGSTAFHNLPRCLHLISYLNHFKCVLIKPEKQDSKNKEKNMCVSPLCESIFYFNIFIIENNVSDTSYEQKFLDRSSSKLRRIYLLRKRGLRETKFCTKIINDCQNAHEGREVAQCGSFQDEAVLPMLNTLSSDSFSTIFKTLIDARCAQRLVESHLKFTGNTVLKIDALKLSSCCYNVLSSTMTHCTKLERLCIHDTDFHDCLLDLSNMTELRVLDISGVTLFSSCFDVLGSKLTHCTKLERLCIHDTDFHDCVFNLSNMSKLKVLDVSGVTLSSSCCDVLGSTLTHCTKLERLCIHDTDFHDCVLDLSNMTELRVLDISGVTLSSSCCDVLGSTLTECTKLERLIIHDTDFHNCLLDLSNMTELRVLDISGVTLSNICCYVLCSTLTHCTKLERLCIHDTDFHNCLLDLSNMTELRVQDISGETLSSTCDVLGSTLAYG